MEKYLCKISWAVDADSKTDAQRIFVNDLATIQAEDAGGLCDCVTVKTKKLKKHHLTPCEADGRGINGHSAFYCSVNEIVILSNNDILGNKWHLDEGKGEGSETIWYPSPTACAIAYYNTHN